MPLDRGKHNDLLAGCPPLTHTRARASASRSEVELMRVALVVRHCVPHCGSFDLDDDADDKGDAAAATGKGVGRALPRRECLLANTVAAHRGCSACAST